jgi:uncharacterized LabA/DUF88 family protein
MPQGPSGVIFLWGLFMPLVEPATKRAISFVDGQNLYRSVKECFGYHYPNFDVLSLSHAVCQSRYGCNVDQARFYTGVPPLAEDPRWHHFWHAKLSAMSRQGIYVYDRPTRNGKEKGIDVRIALDVIGMAHRNLYDIAVIFSQDQDLSEIVAEIKALAQEQQRWIKVACAYPCAAHINKRGINQTEWVRITKEMYDACIDPRDYRPKSSRSAS